MHLLLAMADQTVVEELVEAVSKTLGRWKRVGDGYEFKPSENYPLIYERVMYLLLNPGKNDSGVYSTVTVNPVIPNKPEN